MTSSHPGLAGLLATLLILAGTAWAVEAVITGDHTVEWNGRTYRTIDDQGVYFIDQQDFQDQHPGVPFPEVNRTLTQNHGERAVIVPIIGALTDYIDCSGTSHGFFDGSHCNNANRPSRLVTLGGRTFRVTGELYDNFTITFYWYDFATGGQAGEPHLLLAESVNDRERYTQVSINALSQERAGLGWAPPHAGEPDINPWGDPWWQNNTPKTQQGPVFEPDVGITIYTGREFPTTGERFTMPVLFHAKSTTQRVVISSERMYESFGSQDGAAVSRMWVFRLTTQLDRPALNEPEAPEQRRRFGLYFPHSWYLLAHHGTPVRTAAQRVQNYHRLFEYLKHGGMNWLEFNAINGSDRTEHSWYTNAGHFPSDPAADLLAEMPPVAEQHGIGLLPVITSLKEPRNWQGISWSNDSYQRNTNGDYTRAFGNRLPDPLRPEVQQVVSRLVDEIASRTASADAVKGLGLRVSGKIGLCYAAHQDGWRGSQLSGYSAWNLQQYKDATGSGVPTGPPGTAYDWLRARPNEWEAWLDFRCQRMRTFWLGIRDQLRGYRPDWELYIKCVLPAEVPGTNIEWPGETPLNLLRHAGYDPRMYVDDEGIVIQRGMMVAEERYFSRARWMEPFGANYANYKQFHYAPGLPELYVTAAGRACEIYHNYTEMSHHPFNEFGHPCGAGGFRTTTPAAVGRNFFEPILMSLRRQDVDTLTLMGWNRAGLGHEHALRQFSQAYLALPSVDPQPIQGGVSPAMPEVVARWYDDRLAVMNDTSTARTVTLTFAQPFPAGEELVAVGSGKVLLDAAQAERAVLTLAMDAWSLETFVHTTGEAGPTHTPVDTPTFTPTSPPTTPTHTPTASQTPTWSFTPTVTHTPQPGDLLNGDFEVGFDPAPPTFQDDPSHPRVVARHWTPWNINWWTDSGPDGNRYRSPTGAQSVGTDWGALHNALYQQVDAVPGATYHFSAWTMLECSVAGGDRMWRSVGIDPAGGVDPLADTVIYSEQNWSEGTWARQNVEVEAESGQLTVFIRCRTQTIQGWQWCHMDDAALHIVDLDATPTPSPTVDPSAIQGGLLVY